MTFCAYFISKYLFFTFPARFRTIHLRLKRRSDNSLFFCLPGWMIFRRGVRGRAGMVLLQPARPQVRDGAAHEPRHAVRVLEGHGQGPAHLPPPRRRGRDAQDAGVLPGQGAAREQDGVGHARVPRGRSGRCRLTTSQGICLPCLLRLSDMSFRVVSANASITSPVDLSVCHQEAVKQNYHAV
jgi:hypothetical protein